MVLSGSANKSRLFDGRNLTSKKVKGFYAGDRKFILRTSNFLYANGDLVPVSRLDSFNILSSFIGIVQNCNESLDTRIDCAEKIGAYSLSYSKVIPIIKIKFRKIRKIRDTIVSAHLKFAYLIASECCRNVRTGVHLEENFQDALVGIEKAVMLFDHTKNNNFTAYSKNWINNNIITSLRGNYHIYTIPNSVLSDYRKILRKFDKDTLMEFSSYTISKATGLLPERVAFVIETVEGSKHLSVTYEDNDSGTESGFDVQDDNSSSVKEEDKADVYDKLKLSNLEKLSVLGLFGLELSQNIDKRLIDKERQRLLTAQQKKEN
ncbi:MAG: hypothetical protein EOM67_16430 [Spirochaetia bacterium]|nr:hypothetical protein [Spirochaetia bacterium]